VPNLVERQTLEILRRDLQLLNNFNWAIPGYGSPTEATFGRITSMARTPRIIEFGIHYGF